MISSAALLFLDPYRLPRNGRQAPEGQAAPQEAKPLRSIGRKPTGGEPLPAMPDLALESPEIRGTPTDNNTIPADSFGTMPPLGGDTS